MAAWHGERILLGLTLGLMVLTPVSWFAPLLRAGLLPIFGLSEISVLSGIASLWREGEAALAALVAFLALLAPMAKLAALALLLSGRLPDRFLHALEGLDRLAMADVFLIAVYVTLAKGIAVGRVETAWGLWLFTFCVLAALTLSVAARRWGPRAG